MMKKLRENALAFSLLAGLLTVAFGAWFGIEAKIDKKTSQLTPLTQHQLLQAQQQLLEAEVQKTGINVEELRLQGDLRFFQAQYFRECRTPQQKNSQNCHWLLGQIENIKLQLQGVRTR